MNFREVLFDSQSKTDFSIISLVIKQKCFSRNMIIYKMHLQKNKNSGKWGIEETSGYDNIYRGYQVNNILSSEILVVFAIK